MTQRRGNRWHGYVVMAALMGGAACGSSAPTFDLLVKGGEVIDGRGSPRTRADIGVNGDRIVALGDLSAASATTVIDATGRIVSPGFIDVQGQSGTTLLIDGNGESHLRQGITSEIIGEGDSPAFWSPKTASPEALTRAGQAVDWTSFDEYFARLTTRGIAINLGTLIPATLVRNEVIGMANRPPTAEELARMEALVARAMADGAFGLSSALIYVPGSFASTEELVALAKVAGKQRGIYVTHIRGESFNLFNALDEALRIGREGALPVVIFHLKVGARANWGRMGEALKKIADAAAAGQKVSATMYPYAAGGTRLAAVLPLWAQEGGTEAMLARLADPAQRARIHTEVETTTDGWENLLMAATFEGVQVASVPADYDQAVVGKRLSEIAAARKADPWDVLFDVITGTKGRAGALFHMMSEDGRAHRTLGAVRHDWHRLGGDPRRGSARARAAASAGLRHVSARARQVRARGTGDDTRRRGAAHDRAGGRAVLDSRSRRGARRATTPTSSCSTRRPSATPRPTRCRISTRGASTTWS